MIVGGSFLCFLESMQSGKTEEGKSQQQNVIEDSRFLLLAYCFLLFFAPSFCQRGKVRGQIAPAKTTMQK